MDPQPVTVAAEHDALHIQDQALLQDLQAAHSTFQSYSNAATGLSFNNQAVADLAMAEYDTQSISSLEQFLNDQGTLDIPIVRGYSVTVDGVQRDVAMVAATEIGADGTNHGDMSSMLYLRDQIQAASALMELSLLNPDKYAAEGAVAKELLISALHLMATPSQLERFGRVIRLGEQAGQADWPQISLYFDDLQGTRPNGWRNKQDSFQMLAYTTLDAIERGFLDANKLSDAHKEFLSSVVPLLKSVGFPHYENSGSWEEITAVRTSVMAIETALLHKMKTLVERDNSLDFINQDHEMLGSMVQDGLRELGRRLPYESPDYDPTSIKFRESDAALAYVLRYDLPNLLADSNIPMAANGGKPMSADAIENTVLEQLYMLVDPETNGIIRYRGDSYQRVNFHTNSVQSVIKDIKRQVLHDARQHGGEIDLDKKQSLRDQLTPVGPSAAWTHPLGQLASWAAKRGIAAKHAGDQLQANRYREISTRFLNAALSTVTGENQWHAVLDANGRYQLRKVPAYKLPECYVAYQTSTGKIFYVPSPHTPLNWSSAMLKEAIGMLNMAVQ